MGPRHSRDLIFLSTAGKVFIQTDILDSAIHMRSVFHHYGADSFEPASEHKDLPTFVHSWPEDHAQISAQIYYGMPESRAETENIAENCAKLVPHALERHSFSSHITILSDSGPDLEKYRSIMHALYESAWPVAGWLRSNPLNAPTEREVFVETVTKGTTYRLMLVRK